MYESEIKFYIKAILISLIPAFTYIIYLGYSKAAIAILVTWVGSYLFITRNIIVGFSLITIIVGSYLFIPQVNTEIDKLFYKEIKYYDGSLSEELEYTLLGGRFLRWEAQLDRFFESDIIGQMFGYRFNIGIISHNDFLRVLVSYGFFGFVIYVFFILLLSYKVLLTYFKYKDGLSFGAVFLFISFFIDSLGLTPSIYTGYSWVVFGVIGLSINRNIHEIKKE
jgi:O-antigen ligase